MSDPAELKPGALFARDFRIVRHLAEGGMGAVYVAEQLSTGKQRALKVMHHDVAGDARSRERFVAEAQVGSRIESDHVVEVIVAGVDDATGVPFLAMELLRGQTLEDEVTARGCVAPADVLEIFAQTCHALAQAHALGVVHRDLKPENLFLATPRRSDVRFTVKLLDFGIAKWVSESRAGLANSQVIGTPLWMAPEQLQVGRAITPATDVWALGLIGFYLLTGKRYWLAANVRGGQVQHVLAEVALKPLPPATTRAAELGVASRVPPPFDDWFARCVDRAAERRYASAQESLAGLRAALGPPPARSSPAPPPRAAPVFVATALGAPEPPDAALAAALAVAGDPAEGAALVREWAPRLLALPDGPGRALALAAESARAGRTRAAAELYRHVIAREPRDVEAFGALYDLRAAEHSPEAQWSVAAAMTFALRERARPDAWGFYAQGRASGTAAPRGVLSSANAPRELWDPGDDAARQRVLALFAAAVAQAPASAPTSRGVARIAPAQSESPVAQAVLAAAHALGVAVPELELRDGLAGAFETLGLAPPLLVVRAGLEDTVTPREMLFAAGRSLARHRAEYIAAVLAPTSAELDALLACGLALAAGREPPYARLGARMREVVPRACAAVARDPDALRALREAAALCSSAGEGFDAARWLRGVERAASRAGLLLTGDLHAAQAMLDADPPGVAGLDVAESLRDLIAFSVSDEWLALRRALGLASAAG
jgi:tRNA A-37 threonylcarbamoyl transferase component Bud32